MSDALRFLTVDAPRTTPRGPAAVANEFSYVGTELDLFAHAEHWKSYWCSQMMGFVRGDVLEVGAGIGVNTRLLCDGKAESWTCLEPDAKLAGRLLEGLKESPFARRCHVIVGTVPALERSQRFDSIIYVDVLEHIEDDRDELARVALHLKANGAIVVLAPAHQWLYTRFDEAIGHYRRYTKETLAAAAPPGLNMDKLVYLDSVGLMASLANRLFLRRGMPSMAQIRFWDRYFVLCSRWLDPLVGYSVGKSVLGVWRKTI